MTLKFFKENNFVLSPINMKIKKLLFLTQNSEKRLLFGPKLAAF